MAFLDKYNAINRNTIQSDDKATTRDQLIGALNDPTTKTDAINVVKVLVDFKAEQARNDTADRMLGSLTAPLEALNRKRSADPIREDRLYEFVRNRSAIFKRALPDTFKGLLRDHYLRDPAAKRIIVDTNTAAFLKTNDLITQADVAAARPVAARGGQLLAIDIERMMNKCDEIEPYPQNRNKTTTLCTALLQSLADYKREEHLWDLYKPSFERLIRSITRGDFRVGKNYGETLLRTHSTIATKSTLQSFTTFVKNNNRQWVPPAGKAPVGYGGDSHGWLYSGAPRHESKEDWIREVRQPSAVEFVAKAKSLFPPALFADERGPTAWDATRPATTSARNSQPLKPDVARNKLNDDSPYVQSFTALRNDIRTGYAPRDTQASDFDMLMVLSCNQALAAWANRVAFFKAKDEHLDHPELRLLADMAITDEAGNFTNVLAATTGGKGLNPWPYPIRLAIASKEVTYLLHCPNPLTVPNVAGPTNTFWRYRTFTVRFAWSFEVNFVSFNIIGATPWVVRHECPMFQVVSQNSIRHS
jgi:hypothetical protein